MVADWKLDFMAKAALEHLWKDRKASVLLAIDLIKRYYRDERTNDGLADTAGIQAKLEKATVRLQNLIAMRADGEITKEEYQAMRTPIDEQIRSLQKSLEEVPATEATPKGLQLDKIIAQLKSSEGITESLKAADPIAWTQCMNNITARAEEIIRKELIYNG